MFVISSWCKLDLFQGAPVINHAPIKATTFHFDGTQFNHHSLHNNIVSREPNVLPCKSQDDLLIIHVNL